MRQCKPNPIQTPAFKAQLRTALHQHELHVMHKKIVLYRTAAIAAVLLLLVSTIFVTVARERIDINQTYKRITENLKNNDILNNDELEKVITEESLRTGTPVYPTEVTQKVVKTIRLNNGKEVVVESEMDNQHYAIAF